MADQHNNTDTPNGHRAPPSRDHFYASGNEPSLSTRGQSLAGLVQSQSTSNLVTLRRQHLAHNRRSSFEQDGGYKRTSEDGDDDLIPEMQSRVLGSIGSSVSRWGGGEERRRQSIPASLVTPQMRSQRLIGYNNPRYRWEQYWKTEEDLKKMKKPLRQYYERTNYLIQHYMYIDRLLDSSLPHNLIQEYDNMAPKDDRGLSRLTSPPPKVPDTIREEATPSDTPRGSMTPAGSEMNGGSQPSRLPARRPPNPKDIYKIKDDENTPLIPDGHKVGDEEIGMPPLLEPDEETGSQSRVVKIAIYLNLAANTILLILKIIVVALSSSVSVLASLVDAALDFLSTAIVWTTTRLISRNDQYAYPIGRRRLEPIGVLVFSVIMITSFVQVALEGFNKLTGPDHIAVRLTPLAIAIMAATVVIKFLCWLWCRLVKNSSVQALAQDAMTDVVFNIFSIIFPLVGYYADYWWLDPLGGIVLSFYVIFNWAQTSSTHIRNLTGAAASADERNILLYLTMRFAKSVKKIQGLQAYHSGDKLNVEVDIVLDEETNLKDSHDLGESLQYVLESVPNGQ